MIILGYLFTVLNYAFYYLSRFMKQKVTILTLELVAKIFNILALYCLSSLSGVYTFIVTFFLLIVVNIKERLGKEWLWGYIFFQSLYFIILYTTYAGISSILVVLTVSINLFAIWFWPPQKMRLAGTAGCITYLAYQISIKNWAGLLEIFALFSNVISFIKYKKKKRTKIRKSLTAQRRR